MNSANDWHLTEQDQKQIRKIKKTRIAISLLIATVGAIILSFQLVPLANSYLLARVIDIKASTLVSPVPGSIRTEINGEFAYWDPSASYFSNLIGEASQGKVTQTYDPVTDSYQPIKVDTEYEKPMSLSISSLNIDNINVTSNTPSFDEDTYNEVLEDGLAHFKGTPVCGDGGNCLIYGHSAVQTYFQNHENDPETIFTRLENIDIGDDVTIQRDGEDLRYTVRKKKVVDPADFSILQSQGGKETVTLMTCTPIGIGTHRLIVIAERYE